MGFKPRNDHHEAPYNHGMTHRAVAAVSRREPGGAALALEALRVGLGREQEAHEQLVAVGALRASGHRVGPRGAVRGDNVAPGARGVTRPLFGLT